MLMLILNVVYVLIAVSMVVLVLMQRGAGAQAGSGFGGGASATVFGSRGASNFLSKSTKWLAIAFFAISLFIGWHATHSAAPGASRQDLGVMGGAVPSAPAGSATVPAAPTAPAPASTVPAAPMQAPVGQDTVPAAPAQATPQPQPATPPASGG